MWFSKLEGRALEVLDSLAFLGARQEDLHRHLVAAAGSGAGQSADRQVVGVSDFEHIVFKAEHKDDGVGVVDIGLLGHRRDAVRSEDDIAVLVEHRFVVLVGEAVAAPNAHGEGIELHIEAFTEIVEAELVFVDEVGADGDVTEGGLLLALALEVEVGADVGSEFQHIVEVAVGIAGEGWRYSHWWNIQNRSGGRSYRRR